MLKALYKIIIRAKGVSIKDVLLDSKLSEKLTQPYEKKIEQLFFYVRNAGFDNLRASASVNPPGTFPCRQDVIEARDKEGHSFLHWACLCGDLAFICWYHII